MAKKKKKDDDEKPKKKAKAKPREEEEEVEEEEEYSPSAAGKPKLDIYVGLSGVTLLVLVAAAIFFYLDHDAAKKTTLPQVSVTLGPLQPQAKPQPPQQ